MIIAHLKKRNVAAVIYVGCMVASVWLSRQGRPDAADIFIFPAFLSLVAACWFYLKAKNRSGGWLLLLPLNLVALIIYWCMDDCSAEPDNIPCPKCGTANFPADSNCRLCKAQMVPDLSS